jgi:hypothetical protein
VTRASRIDVKYVAPKTMAPGLHFTERAAQRAASKRRMMMIACTVGELIEVLGGIDRDMRVMTTEPPFDGVKLVLQENGAVLICRPRAPESRCAPASRDVDADLPTAEDVHGILKPE